MRIQRGWPMPTVISLGRVLWNRDPKGRVPKSPHGRGHHLDGYISWGPMVTADAGYGSMGLMNHIWHPMPNHPLFSLEAPSYTPIVKSPLAVWETPSPLDTPSMNDDGCIQSGDPFRDPMASIWILHSIDPTHQSPSGHQIPLDPNGEIPSGWVGGGGASPLDSLGTRFYPHWIPIRYQPIAQLGMPIASPLGIPTQWNLNGHQISWHPIKWIKWGPLHCSAWDAHCISFGPPNPVEPQWASDFMVPHQMDPKWGPLPI